MSFFLPLWISFPSVIHSINTMYRLNISTRYIVLVITNLSTASVDKFSTFYPHRGLDVAAQYINALYPSHHFHNPSRSIELSTASVDKFSTFYPHRGLDVAAQYINALYYTGFDQLIHIRCG
jgi:hypothetical protein